MSERVSREDVDQLVNGVDFNPNTLLGGLEQAPFNANGMSLQDYLFDPNNDLGLAGMGIPQLPGQSVDQAYNDTLGRWIQQPINHDKPTDKPQEQDKLNNEFANGFPTANQFPTNNRVMPMNNVVAQNGYTMPMNGFAATNNFDVTNGFVLNKEFAGTNFAAVGNDDASHKGVMSAQKFDNLDDDEVNKMLNLDIFESDGSENNAEKTSVTSGVVDPALALGSTVAGNTSSFNLGNLASGLPTPTPTPAKNGFVNVVASTPKGHGNGTQFQQPLPATHNVAKTPVSNIDPFLVAQSAQRALPEQMYDENGRPIVAFTAAQLEQRKQKQANQPQKSFAPQAAIHPRQVPVQPVRRVGQHYSVPRQNVVNTEQAVHMNKQQQVLQQNQQALQPVAQVNRQQAQPVTQRAPVQVQQPVSVQYSVPIQQSISVEQPVTVQQYIAPQQSAPSQSQHQALRFPQVSASPTKKTSKQTVKKTIQQTPEQTFEETDDESGNESDELDWVPIDNDEASGAKPAPRGRRARHGKNKNKNKKNANTKAAQSSVLSTAQLSAQKTPSIDIIMYEAGQARAKAPTAPKQPTVPKSRASAKKPTARKAPAPAKQAVAPKVPHPADFNKPQGPPARDTEVREPSCGYNLAELQKLGGEFLTQKGIDLVKRMDEARKKEEAIRKAAGLPPLPPLEDAAAVHYASATDDASTTDDASALTDPSDLEETSASEVVPIVSEVVPTAARVITKIPSEVVVSKKKRGKQSAVTVESEGPSSQPQRQSSQNGDLNRKSSDHEVRQPVSGDNIDPQLKAASSNDEGSKITQELIHTIAHQAYLLGANHAQSSIFHKTTKNLREFGTFCGFQFQLPEDVSLENAVDTCRSTMDVIPEMEKQSGVAVAGVLIGNKHFQQHIIPSGTDAITPPASSPASDMIADNENDTVTVSEETQPQTIEQPQIIEQTQITDKTSSTKVTPIKTTANNKRKSDAEDSTKVKKARTDKSDVPTVQHSTQLILPNAPLITTKPQSTEVTESTQVTQPAIDATTKPVSEVSDTEMVDAPAESSRNVDYCFGLGISFDFETGIDEPKTTTEPTTVAEPETLAELETTTEPEAVQEIVQPEIIAQPETVLWPESDPRDNLALPPDMFMRGADGPPHAHIQAALDENRQSHQTDEEFLNLWDEPIVPQQDEEQFDVYGERMQEEEERFNLLSERTNQEEQLDMFDRPVPADPWNAANWPQW
ncbi:hypothetical protein LRP88_07030 [Fusarium phalaenopsidis]